MNTHDTTSNKPSVSCPDSTDSAHPGAAGDPPLGETPIGIDLGVRNMVVAAPFDAGAEVDSALVVDGTVERAMYNELSAVTARLEAMEADTAAQDRAMFREYHDWFMARFAHAVADVWDYLDRFENPVLVLEDLSQDPRSLFECRSSNADVGTWLMPAFQQYLSTCSECKGYRVEYVAPEFTTKECHLCGVHGERKPGGRLRCINDACAVDVACRDKSAAVSIAKRSPSLTGHRDRASGGGRAEGGHGGVVNAD